MENAAFFRDWLDSEGRRLAGEKKKIPAGKTATVELNLGEAANRPLHGPSFFRTLTPGFHTWH